MSPLARPLIALVAAVLLPACGPEAPPPPDPAAALIGTWEVTGEVGSFNRNGQRYTFGDDGSLFITRPPALGPASTINAAYDFVDDSTLRIRSEFDAEDVLPTVRGDSLLLRPLGTGEPLLLVRIPDAPPPTPAPPPVVTDSVYSPPPDAPLDELPPAQVPAESAP